MLEKIKPENNYLKSPLSEFLKNSENVDSTKIEKFLMNRYPNEYDATSEIWKLLLEKGVLHEGKYIYYHLDDSIKLLLSKMAEEKTVTEKETASKVAA